MELKIAKDLLNANISNYRNINKKIKDNEIECGRLINEVKSQTQDIYSYFERKDNKGDPLWITFIDDERTLFECLMEESITVEEFLVIFRYGLKIISLRLENDKLRESKKIIVRNMMEVKFECIKDFPNLTGIFIQDFESL